ncbi:MULTISPECIES: ABC transporter substrate-binding protein [Olivibacter]|jgi:putative ABC transport system substrate-binding protein|uniref:ABC transporter substrate-binding protein n=1 Tax=Olivibacter oleidegradans TaxID=760123 RepID=A0ABV6HJM5_9SPHI|nr:MULTISPECIES: ABC transporter substrate-binding protein [Olivibacter]QEL01906.1 substrate-binding domain-containing protein [Olivibacter sp. LS-1]
MKYNRFLILLLFAIGFISCNNPKKQGGVPRVGFIEAFEDATIGDARKGFIEALAASGFSEQNKTVEIIAKNAQGDMGAMNQIVSYMQSEEVDCIGTSTTMSTLATVQRIKNIPIFMCVTAMPQILGLINEKKKGPDNLFGVGEDLNYIDTSFAIIQQVVKPKKKDNLRIGMIYNQAEQQSVDAFNRLDKLAKQKQVELIALPLNTSADAQLVVRALLKRKIDAFFANPDNTVFAAFETILNNCNERGIPVFTSEVGLVKRGAVAAYGADIYQWGYQAGQEAAKFLKSKKTDKLTVEKVKIRRRVYNGAAATRFGLTFSENFEKL